MRAISIALMIVWIAVASVVWAGNAAVTQTISSSPPTAGTWTSSISPTYPATKQSGYLNISIYGASWSATVTLQRSFDSGTTWFDVTTWTANSEQWLKDEEHGVLYRLGVKNGAYTTGSVAVRLSN